MSHEKPSVKQLTGCQVFIYFALTCIIVTLIWLGGSWVLVRFIYGGNLEHAGQRGDSFGAINALFTGLAFASLIITIWIQRRDLEASLAELKHSVDAQREQAQTLRRNAELEALISLFQHEGAAMQEANQLFTISRKERIARAQRYDQYANALRDRLGGDASALPVPAKFAEIVEKTPERQLFDYTLRALHQNAEGSEVRVVSTVMLGNRSETSLAVRKCRLIVFGEHNKHTLTMTDDSVEIIDRGKSAEFSFRSEKTFARAEAAKWTEVLLTVWVHEVADPIHFIRRPDVVERLNIEME